jgi:hypothetical protein
MWEANPFAEMYCQCGSAKGFVSHNYLLRLQREVIGADDVFDIDVDVQR